MTLGVVCLSNCFIWEEKTRENAKFKSQKQIRGSKLVRWVKYKRADGCARAPGCTSRQVAGRPGCRWGKRATFSFSERAKCVAFCITVF